MENNSEIRRGLNLLYIATILDIVSTFLSRSVIAVLVCSVVSIVFIFIAVLKMKDADRNYEKAFAFFVIYTVVNVLNYLFIARLSNSMFVSFFTNLIMTGIFVTAVFHIIKGTNFLLQKNGYEELVAKGKKAWKMYLVFNVIYMFIIALISFVSYWPDFIVDYLNSYDMGLKFLLILTLLGILAGIIAKVFYALYLKKTKEKV